MMQSYVSGKNPVRNGGQSGSAPSGMDGNEDLKVQLQRKSSRRRSKAIGQGMGVSAESKPSQQPHGRRGSTEPKHFYDTDASSVGRTSTDMSFNGKNVALVEPSGALKVEEELPEEQQPPDSPTTDGSASEDLAENHLNGLGNQPLSEELFAKMKNIDAGLRRQQGGSKWPYMPGDSHPPTTSGRLSSNEVDIRDGVESRPDRRLEATSSNALPNSINSHRQQLGKSSVRPQADAKRAAGAMQAAQLTTQAGFFARQDESGVDSLQKQAAVQFNFSKPPEQKPSVRTSLPTRQQGKPQPTTSHGLAPRQAAQQHVLPTTNHMSDRSAKANDAIEMKKEGPPPPGSNHLVEDQNKAHQPGHPRDLVLRVPPAQQHYSDVELVMNARVSPFEHIPHESEEDERQLDYKEPQLSNMDYQDLKNQPFDIDPKAEPFNFPPHQQKDELQDKLFTVATLRPQDQFTFFTTLSIDEWEQAGDWFLDRFSATVGKLKKVRQAKRKAAHVFEDEIEGRFEAVTKKRKLIEASLGEMRESGGKVLTPRKTKTK